MSLLQNKHLQVRLSGQFDLKGHNTWGQDGVSSNQHDMEKRPWKNSREIIYKWWICHVSAHEHEQIGGGCSFWIFWIFWIFRSFKPRSMNIDEPCGIFHAQLAMKGLWLVGGFNPGISGTLDHQPKGWKSKTCETTGDMTAIISVHHILVTSTHSLVRAVWSLGCRKRTPTFQTTRSHNDGFHHQNHQIIKSSNHQVITTKIRPWISGAAAP